MNSPKKPESLKKELKLLDVYALATGTTLSAGFFLLPGLAAVMAGPAIVLAYLVAALPIIPATFSIVELTTAMPKAGGEYYFLDRSMGPLFGTVGGLGNWLALVLKVAFALIGMGVYVGLFIPDLPITPVAIGIALALGVLNLIGAKISGGFQVIVVLLILVFLIVFLGAGVPEVKLSHFDGFFDSGLTGVLATAAFVYISYGGITKVTSLSEEVVNPERNLPLGIFLALLTAIILYVLGAAIMVGVVPMDRLAGDLSPVATLGGVIFGKVGIVAVSVAALLGFISVANSGTMSASRYPLAMSRDLMMPGFLQKLGNNGIPFYSIIVTVGTIVAILLLLDTSKIVKIASAFQILMFTLVCVAVIVMRESKIESYDPSYRSPLYPWMQIFGILGSLWLLVNMGGWIKIATIAMVLVGVVWYKFYVKNKVVRSGAIYHMFETLGRSRYEGLDRELRGILKEKELRKEDPFDELVARSYVIDINRRMEFDEVVEQASVIFSELAKESSDSLRKRFMEGTLVGATPVSHEVALPHLRLEGLAQMEMVMVRSKPGIYIKFRNPVTDQDEEQTLRAIFFLASPLDNPSQHLRMLAQIARHVENEDFANEWEMAEDEQQLKEAILHDERFHSIYVHKDSPTESLIGRQLKELKMPEGSLIALIRRGEEIIIPRGNTVLEENDRITVIGEPSSMREFHKRYIG
ncbi:MAG: amino acid permease [Deltaproteobacteria bacterium]